MTKSPCQPYQPLLRLLEGTGRSKSVADLTELGTWLAELIELPRPFSYRQLVSVANGTISPGRYLERAIVAALAMADRTPRQLAASDRVEVLAMGGSIQPGSLVMGDSRVCPACSQRFVSDNARRRYCPICRPRQRRE